jgi:hypothetical protein
MKNPIKEILTVLVVFLFTSPILAQTSFSSDLSYNLKYMAQNQDEKKDKKVKDEFKVYGGLNFNTLKLDNEKYESTAGVGWLLGGSYKRGRFFYWELGARYNRAVFEMGNISDTTAYLGKLFGVSNIDVPITFGINTLWFISRIVGVRVFVSAVPEFVLGVRDNDLGITKDDLNTFNFCGQGGVGVDITFIFLEAGINYGFNDLLKNRSPSNPLQVFINLGFRF